MKTYVLIFAEPPDYDGEVLVVTKNKPEWQKGKKNLVGGKIEQGETPQQAAEREFQEETGYFIHPSNKPFLVGKIVGEQFTVFVYKIYVYGFTLNPGPDETETVSWERWVELQEDKNLIPNLRVIIPLIMAGVTDWVVNDDTPSLGKEEHSFTVTVPTYLNHEKIEF